MERINIGFDLGVASVGWSVYSVDNKKLIDKGVKLFYQANKAEDRRMNRALRRRYKRTNHRIERLDDLLKSYGKSFEVETDNNLLKSRIDGLTKEISEQKLVNILRFILKYRGYYPTGDDDRNNIYKDKYPELYACQVQKIILEEQGHYRGLEYPFLISDFRKEVKKILEVQSGYISFVDDLFINSFFNIYNSRREFWEGPGGAREDQLTPFGRYRNETDLEKYDENKAYRKYLYQELIKDCNVFVGEKSAPKDSFDAQRFNFLNDMINFSFKYEQITAENSKYFYLVGKDTYKLNLEGINYLQSYFLNGASVNIKSIFKKNLGISIDLISGFRIDRDKKIEITKFEIYNKIRRLLEKNGLPTVIIENKEIWNQICDVKTIVPGGSQKEQLEENIDYNFSNKEMEIVLKENFNKEYHAFSHKALKVYIKKMEELLINSSTLERKYPELINNEVQQKLIDEYFADERTIKMSKKPIDNLVASPQVKKSLRVAIKTFNEIRKKYSKKDGYYIDTIVIESNKEILNEKSKRDFEYNQNENEKKRNAARKQIEDLVSPENNVEKLIEKQLLLEETNYKCLYCDDIVNINSMEVEHVLPISKSADDSFANKVCSCKTCNSAKDNKTPYEYLGHNDIKWSSYLKRVDSLKGISQEKLKNLKFTDNINKYEKRFIARNLRDTAYITKEFKNQFEIYKNALIEKRDMKEEFLFKVVSMPPQITGKVRKQLLEDKDRTKHYHHAFDASICAMYPTTKLGKLTSEIQNEPDKYWKAKSLSTDIHKMTKDYKFTNEQALELKSINYNNTRFYSEVKRSGQGQLCNADINKVLIHEEKKGKKSNTVYKKIEYIPNIYALDKEGVKKLGEMLIKDNSAKVLGVKYNDRPTFEYLKQIYINYTELKYKGKNGKEFWMNPFMHYCLEQNEITQDEFDNNIGKYGIRPPSKKGKLRPVIKRLNYSSKVSSPYLLKKKSINIKEGNNIMLDKLSTTYTIVYENVEKGGYLFLPVYSVFTNLKTGEINEDNYYYQQLKAELIGDVKVKQVMTLTANEYVKVTKKDGSQIEGRVSGYDKDGDRFSLKSKNHTGKTPLRFTKSVSRIEKIPVYGLGIYGMNLDE